ncbi:hypothetical protein D3C83_09170 [compost metagenome]
MIEPTTGPVRSRQHAALRGQRFRVGAVPDRAEGARPRGVRGAQPGIFPAVPGGNAGHPRVSRFPAEAAVAPPASAARCLAPRLHAVQDPPADTRQGALARREPSRRLVRHDHRHQQFRHRADRERVRHGEPDRDRAGAGERQLHRGRVRHPVLPRGQGRAARGLACGARQEARLVSRVVVLQRFPERPAVARARHPSRGG